MTGGVAQCGVSTRLSQMWHGFKSRPVDAICGLNYLLVLLSLFSTGFFFSGTVLYCTVMRSGIVDEEPFCGCAAYKLFIYLFIYGS